MSTMSIYDPTSSDVCEPPKQEQLSGPEAWEQVVQPQIPTEELVSLLLALRRDDPCLDPGGYFRIDSATGIEAKEFLEDPQASVTACCAACYGLWKTSPDKSPKAINDEIQRREIRAARLGARLGLPSGSWWRFTSWFDRRPRSETFPILIDLIEAESARRGGPHAGA